MFNPVRSIEIEDTERLVKASKNFVLRHGLPLLDQNQIAAYLSYHARYDLMRLYDKICQRALRINHKNTCIAYGYVGYESE